jgi:hypothetical protein
VSAGVECTGKCEGFDRLHSAYCQPEVAIVQVGSPFLTDISLACLRTTKVASQMGYRLERVRESRRTYLE